MKRDVFLAEAAGFCFGVKKAIEKAESMDRAFIFGSLIHNPQEVSRLASAGKKIVHSLEEVEGRQVVITAHGLDLPTLENIRAKGFELVDTTCPLVTRIYNEGIKLQGKGLRIVILDDRLTFPERVTAVQHHDLFAGAGEKPHRPRVHGRRRRITLGAHHLSRSSRRAGPPPRRQARHRLDALAYPHTDG